MRPKPVVLAILDGWGVAPKGDGNPVALSKTPNIDHFIKEYPSMTLFASGSEVGLSFGEMGNSEVGHMNIGAGRIYYQTLMRLQKEISDRDFFKNPAFLKAVDQVKKNNSALHLIGLLGFGNVHANQEHCHQLLQLAKDHNLKKVYIHGILDGRDTVYNAGKDAVKELQDLIEESKIGKIASLSGRYYAMDRDNRWNRVEKAYQAMACGKAEQYFSDPLQAIEESYGRKVYDEEFVPVVIGKPDEPVAKISENDAAIFFNFRADRARQLTEAFVLPGFAKFEREYIKNLCFVTMTEYEKEIPVEVAYPPIIVQNCLAEVISKAGLKQFHVAETEKYAHITFFLNGTVEEPFPGEERLIIPSPMVSSYLEAPEMSAMQLTKEVVKAIDEDKYDVIMMNYANADMLGHTGDFAATMKGCETIDKSLGILADHVLSKGGVLLITADHGNAEEIKNLQTGEMDKEHSTNPVPFFIISNELRGQAGPSGDPPEGDLSLMQPVGMLADIAPTILKILNIEQPEEMSGRALN